MPKIETLSIAKKRRIDAANDVLVDIRNNDNNDEYKPLYFVGNKCSSVRCRSLKTGEQKDIPAKFLYCIVSDKKPRYKKGGKAIYQAPTATEVTIKKYGGDSSIDIIVPHPDGDYEVNVPASELEPVTEPEKPEFKLGNIVEYFSAADKRIGYINFIGTAKEFGLRQRLDENELIAIVRRLPNALNPNYWDYIELDKLKLITGTGQHIPNYPSKAKPGDSISCCSFYSSGKSAIVEKVSHDGQYVLVSFPDCHNKDIVHSNQFEPKPATEPENNQAIEVGDIVSVPADSGLTGKVIHINKFGIYYVEYLGGPTRIITACNKTDLELVSHQGQPEEESEPSKEPKFKVGDRVRVIDKDSMYFGHIGIVLEDVSGVLLRVKMGVFHSALLGYESFELVGGDIGPEPKFKVGDRVQPNPDAKGYKPATGTVVAVSEDFRGEHTYDVQWDCDKPGVVSLNYATVLVPAVEPVTEPEHKFEVGDRVKIINSSSVCFGEFGKIINVQDMSSSILCNVRVDGGVTLWQPAAYIEPVGQKSDQERITELERQVEELARLLKK